MARRSTDSRKQATREAALPSAPCSVVPYDPELLEHQEPVNAVSEWQQWNDCDGSESIAHERDIEDSMPLPPGTPDAGNDGTGGARPSEGSIPSAAPSPQNDHAKTIVYHFDDLGRMIGYEIQRASDGEWFSYWDKTVPRS